MLAACFINDLLTVLALGFIFSPFTWKTAAFFGGASAVFAILPFITPRFFKRYGGRPSELEAKFLLLVLFGLGGLATWSGSEAVLPAYLVGMVLAATVGKDHALIRRLHADIRPAHTVLLHKSRLAGVAPGFGGCARGFCALLIGKMVSNLSVFIPPPRFSGRRRRRLSIRRY